MVAGSSVIPHVLKMKGYLDHLEKLGLLINQELAINIILQSIVDAYDGFIMNHNMHKMEKSISELHEILKTAEQNIKTTNNVLMVQNGKDMKRKWVTKGKGKDTKTPKPKPNPNPKVKKPKAKHPKAKQPKEG